jgi:hypothetical protein
MNDLGQYKVSIKHVNSASYFRGRQTSCDRLSDSSMRVTMVQNFLV